nr:LytTR family DNA-binding domain-containing protein [Enterococcus sp. BWB1-3]
MNEFSSKRPKLNQKYGDKVISVYYDEIMFIESSSNMHKLIMHCENRQIEFYGKLKDFEELHESFYRCHNSYIVNKDNVVEVDKKNKSIHLSNGETCYASVRLVKGLLN